MTILSFLLASGCGVFFGFKAGRNPNPQGNPSLAILWVVACFLHLGVIIIHPETLGEMNVVLRLVIVICPFLSPVLGRAIEETFK